MSPELKNRIIFGVAIAAALLLALIFAPPPVILLIAIAAAMLGWHEYARMMLLLKRRSLYMTGFFLLFSFISYNFLSEVNFITLVWMLYVTGFFILYFETIKHKVEDEVVKTANTKQTWTDFCRFVLGVLYVFMLFGFIAPIANRPEGSYQLIMGFMVVAVGDSVAYFVGKKYGKRKLWPEISPGKTIEGAMGAIAGSFLAAALCTFLLFRHTQSIGGNSLFVLFFGLIASPLAQAGDLLESLMKRAANTKDSGEFLPGHGGMLDRADALVFVLPLIYFIFK